LAVAKGLIESGSATNVLLVTSDTYSKYLHRTDWSTRAIFGDAAAATLLTAVESETELIGPFVFGTDGRGAEHLIVPAGGSRRPASVETAVERMTDTGGLRSDQNLRMNGPEMFRFTLQRVPSMVQELLRRADLQLEDVDRFVFHQANGYMLEHLRSKLGIPTEKFCLSLSHCGNTVSSSIPLALADERERGVGRGGETVMTVGFGVGLSWAGTLLRFE
jgi:3-oxoacyl-[acyl-carrier-protein] synthase-3